MRGVFVTGTGTGVGKTIVSAAVVAAAVAGGLRVAAYKPVVTGVDDGPGEWPMDHELLASLTGQSPKEVAPLRLGLAASPHLAAEVEGVVVDPAALVAGARRAAAGAEVIVVEGVGGLLVPLTGEYLVRDFAVELGLPVVVVATPGLGTINHTLLTVGEARAAGLDVRAVVLSGWPTHPANPDAIERSNVETIERLGGVAVALLGRVGAGDGAALSGAGAVLPWRDWMGPGGGSSDRTEV